MPTQEETDRAIEYLRQVSERIQSGESMFTNQNMFEYLRIGYSTDEES